MSEKGNQENAAAVTEQSEKAAESEIKKVQRIRARSSYLFPAVLRFSEDQS
jgi:hypothetical protein